MTRVAVATVVLVAAAMMLYRATDPTARVDVEPTGFLRFVEEEDGSARLETAIVRYKNESGQIIDLVAAVHVADPDYYDLLNALFARYDSVLYEAVAPKEYRPVPGRHDSTLSSFQRGITDVLDLEFQLDGVIYTKDNFVHADLEPDRFFELMDERGENLLTLMLSVMAAEMRHSDQKSVEEMHAQSWSMILAFFAKDRSRALKRVLGRQFGELERIAAGFERGLDGEESVLLIERNKAALDVLEDRLQEGDRTIAIFFGAAHLPDMERRLAREFGAFKTSEQWLVGWDIPAAPDAGASPRK